MRFLRKTELYICMIYESFFSHLLLIILVAGMTLSSVFVMSIFSEYYSVIHLAEKNGVGDKIVYYNSENTAFPPDCESSLILKNRIEEVPGVRSVSYFGDYGVQFRCGGTLQYAYVYDYSSVINGGFSFDVEEGQSIDAGSVNQVLINQNAASQFKAGDKIRITLNDFGLYHSPEGDEYYYDISSVGRVTITVDIVGVVNNDAYALSANVRSFPSRLDDLVRPLSDFYTEENEAVFICGDLQDDEGRTIRISSLSNLLITADPSCSAEEVKENISSALNTNGNIVTYGEMKANYSALNRSLRNTSAKYMICIFLLTFMVYESVLFMKFNRRKEEVLSYYLCGGTWRWCILSSFVMFVPSVILGSLSGWALLVRFRDRFPYSINEYFLQGKVILITGLVYIAVSFAVMLPVFLYLKDKSLKDYERGE
ncbi:MAG: hypothetical protein IKN14_08550 [Clostridiales bacterium]|nr:hypothetical protein [Clostridiales bacterium]